MSLRPFLLLLFLFLLVGRLAQGSTLNEWKATHGKASFGHKDVIFLLFHHSSLSSAVSIISTVGCPSSASLAVSTQQAAAPYSADHWQTGMMWLTLSLTTDSKLKQLLSSSIQELQVKVLFVRLMRPTHCNIFWALNLWFISTTQQAQEGLCLFFLTASKNVLFSSPLGAEQLLYREDGKKLQKVTVKHHENTAPPCDISASAAGSGRSPDPEWTKLPVA